MGARGQRHAPATLYPAARFMVHKKKPVTLFCLTAWPGLRVCPSAPSEMLMPCVERQTVYCNRDWGGHTATGRSSVEGAVNMTIQ